MELLETMNRTMKLAMDEGRVGSYEDAQSLFCSFKLRVIVQPGFSRAQAAEAAVLTLLNAAPRTFLGGVELVGALDERCTMAWFMGKSLGDVAQEFGVTTAKNTSDCMPTIQIGDGESSNDTFWLGIGLSSRGFILSPDKSGSVSEECPVEVGVAAAGAALNEAFQAAYRHSPLAGQREIRWCVPEVCTVSDAESLWLIGLGHLGQAFVWTAALAGSHLLPKRIKISDYDTVSRSSLSTCLLVKETDIGRQKVDVVGDKLTALGVEVLRDCQRVNLDTGVVAPVQEIAVIAVDSYAFRRSLDQLRAKRVIEAGIGDGAEAFTRIQLHAFPGSRMARDIWVGDDPQSVRSIDISKPAYQALLSDSKDECGTTLIAGRSVATPFVGAFAGALLSIIAKGVNAEISAWSYDVNSL